MTEILASHEELLRQRLASAGPKPAGIGTVPRGGPLTLSPAQRRIWLLDQLRPDSTEYLTSVVVRLSGPLDPVALRTALDGLTANHEVLRTRYQVADGEPVALIDPPAPVPFRHATLEGEVHDLIAADRHAIDLAEGPVFLATLAALNDDEHLLVLTAHHIAIDQQSEGVLLRELRERYAGVTVAPPAVQYADFAAWQRERGDHQLTYWRDQLAGATPVALPTDRPRPPVRDTAGDTLTFTVPSPVADALRMLAREHSATPFIVLLAAFHVLLARCSAQHDITVGVPAAGRDRPELWDAVGLFMNTLVVRADLSGEPTFATVVDQVRDTTMAAFDHQELPFEHLVDPLFSTRFGWHDTAIAETTTAGGVTFARVPVADTSIEVDLTLVLTEQPDGSLSGALVFSTALFDRATAQRMADHYVRLLTGAAAAPHRPVNDV